MKKWKTAVENENELNADEKRMLLSRETMEGLKNHRYMYMYIHYTCTCTSTFTLIITNTYIHIHQCYLDYLAVRSFVEMTKYLVLQGDVTFLSERISQDPLENYFGQQRARGGRNENPSMQQCLHNAAAIRVQKSLATDPVRGNCEREGFMVINSLKLTIPPFPSVSDQRNVDS